MESVALSVIPDTTFPVIHASQYDSGRVQRFMLYDRACPYTLSGEETIELRIRKPNNQTETIEIENSGDDYIDLTFTEQLTDTAGDVYCKFSIDDISTKGFYIKVEPGPARIYTGYADGEIAEFETDLEESIIVLNVELSPIQDLNGYDAPWAPGCGINQITVNRTKGTLDGYYPSSVRNFEYNKYYVGLSANNYYQESLIQEYSVGNDEVSMKTGRNSYGMAFPIKVQSNTSYCVGGTLTGTAKLQVSFFDSEGVYIGYKANIVAATVVTTPANCYTMVFIVYDGSASNTTITASNVFVNLPSTVTEYTPYSNICPISGRTTAKIFRNSGNLVDDSIKYVYSASIVYIGTDGHYNTFLRAGTYRASVDFSGERYGLYCRSAEVGNIMIWGSNSGAHESTFVIPKDDYYRFWSYYNPSLGTIDVNKIKWVKVEPGSVTTPYEPYVISPTPVTINFSQTVYSGVIDYAAQVIRAVGKLVKISDYIWTKNSQYGFFSTGVNDMERNPDSGKKLNGLVSEAYVNRSAAQAGSQRINNSIAAWTNQLRIRDDTYDNVTDFVNAMGDTHFLYPLKTPIEIPFSGYTPIPTLKGKNIVYSDSGPVEVAYHRTTPMEGGND